MEPNQTRLSRWQLLGTLLIVFIVAMSLSGYFLPVYWRDIADLQAQRDSLAAMTIRDH